MVTKVRGIESINEPCFKPLMAWVYFDPFGQNGSDGSSELNQVQLGLNLGWVGFIRSHVSA